MDIWVGIISPIQNFENDIKDLFPLPHLYQKKFIICNFEYLEKHSGFLGVILKQVLGKVKELRIVEHKKFISMYLGLLFNIHSNIHFCMV